MGVQLVQLMGETAERIAGGIERLSRSKYDFSQYEDVIKAVNAGDIDLIPQGQEFKVTHAVYGEITYVVMRKNVEKVADDPEAVTVTLMPKYLLSANAGTTAATFQFDRPEAFASVDEEIPAGTICKFTIPATYDKWTAGTYKFTATEAIPAGSKLCMSGYSSTAILSTTVRVYASAKATTQSAQYEITEDDGSATLNLGTFNTDLNHSQRISYGSNNDEESGLLQFLNADTGDLFMDSVWVPKTKYDMMPTAFTSLKGFLGGFPEAFKNALKTCVVHNITNNVFESQDSAHQTNQSYTYNAKVFLPSRKEIYGSQENANEASETQFPYFANIGTENADKLMYAKGATSPTSYWLRTPYASYAYFVRICNAARGGELNNYSAINSIGVVPLAILA